MSNECSGQHRFFLADVVANASEGAVFVLAICTSCGVLKCHREQVGQVGSQLKLLLEEKKKGN